MSKQNRPSERARLRNSQHFKPDMQQLKRYGKRTGQYIKYVDPMQKVGGMARWSDYENQYSESTYIRRDEEDETSFIKQQQSNSESDASELPPQQSEVIQMMTVNPARKQQEQKLTMIVPRKVQTKGKKKVESEPPAQEKTKRILSNESQFKKSQNPQSPFVISKVSNVKDRKERWTGGQSLLKILEAHSAQRKRESEVKVKIEEVEKKENVIVNTMERVKEDDNEEYQENVHDGENIVLPQPDMGDYRKRHSQRYTFRTIKIKENEVKPQLKPKKRRVTINHNGKIRYPNQNSPQQDFEPMLPPSLTKGLESTYHKYDDGRRQIPEEDQDQERTEPEPEPMEVASYRPGEFNDYEDKQDEYRAVSVQQPRIKIKKTKKRTQAQRNLSQQTNKIEVQKYNPKETRKLSKYSTSKQSRPKSQAFRSKSTRAKSPKDIKKKYVKISSKEKAVKEVKQPRRHSKEVIHERPQRVRTKPGQFWLVQEKARYNTGRQRILHNQIQPQEFKEILGFKQANQIRFTLFESSSKSLTFKFTLNGNQQISSYGINLKLLGKKMNEPKKFSTLKMYPCGRSKFNVVGIVDDEEYDVTSHLDEIVVRRGQMFSLQNHSRAKPCTFFAKLFNDNEE